MGKELARFVARKAKEPSTWKGIGWLLVAAGVLPVGAVEGVAGVGLGLVGLVEIIRKEAK